MSKKQYQWKSIELPPHKKGDIITVTYDYKDGESTNIKAEVTGHVDE